MIFLTNPFARWVLPPSQYEKATESSNLTFMTGNKSCHTTVWEVNTVSSKHRVSTLKTVQIIYEEPPITLVMISQPDVHCNYLGKPPDGHIHMLHNITYHCHWWQACPVLMHQGSLQCGYTTQQNWVGFMARASTWTSTSYSEASRVKEFTGRGYRPTSTNPDQELEWLLAVGRNTESLRGQNSHASLTLRRESG